MSDLTISAKNLGALSLPDFCERCFWIKTHAKLPWQIFPGIFSSIDSYTKAVTNVHHEALGKLPDWLEEVWPGSAPEKVPHWSKYLTVDKKSGVTLRGGPDEILRLSDGTLAILDYKTSRITKNADALAPIYHTQLNAYAYIAEAQGRGKVTSLALIYCEPQTKLEVTTQIDMIRPTAFLMPFKIAIRPVDVRLEEIPKLLARADKIYSLERAPDLTEDCKDCAAFEDVAEKLKEKAKA